MSAPDTPALVAEALRRLGGAYRGDWSDLDGRSIQTALDGLASRLVSDEPFDLDWWTIDQGMCPDTLGWASECPSRVPLPDDHPARQHGMTMYGGNNCQHTRGTL